MKYTEAEAELPKSGDVYKHTTFDNVKVVIVCNSKDGKTCGVIEYDDDEVEVKNIYNTELAEHYERTGSTNIDFLVLDLEKVKVREMR